jgi:hypothetical protein
MKTIFAIVLAVLISGCASVPESTMERKTARALGLRENQIQIFDIEREGVETSYTVKTTTGKTYSCYMTAAYSMVGRAVSDAICSSVGDTGGTRSETSRGMQCNDLLKAAGKC